MNASRRGRGLEGGRRSGAVEAWANLAISVRAASSTNSHLATLARPELTDPWLSGPTEPDPLTILLKHRLLEHGVGI